MAEDPKAQTGPGVGTIVLIAIAVGVVVLVITQSSVSMGGAMFPRLHLGFKDAKFKNPQVERNFYDTLNKKQFIRDIMAKDDKYGPIAEEAEKHWLPQASNGVFLNGDGAPTETRLPEKHQKLLLALREDILAEIHKQLKQHTIQQGSGREPLDLPPKLPGDPFQGELINTGSGLRYVDLRVGTGKKPRGRTSRVKVHYTGWLLNGTQFDTSLKGDKKPFDTPLNRVIAGWTEGVGSMKVGGKRKLVIPHRLAYGAQGRPGIPGNATLIFDIELLDVVGE